MGANTSPARKLLFYYPDMLSPLLQRLCAWARTDLRGVVTAEYIVLVGVLGIAIAATIAGLGPPLLVSYERTRGMHIAPIP